MIPATSEARVRQEIDREADAKRWRDLVDYLRRQSRSARLLTADEAALTIRATVSHWYHDEGHRQRVQAVIEAGEEVVAKYFAVRDAELLEPMKRLAMALALIRDERADGVSYATRREP